MPASPPPRLELESAFRAYSRYVAAIAFRMLGCNDEVDDVVQEVFVAALRGTIEQVSAAVITPTRCETSFAAAR